MTIPKEEKGGKLRKLVDLLTRAVCEADFPLTTNDSHGPTLRLLQPVELRQLYGDPDPETRTKALGVWPQLRADSIEELSNCLAQLLGKYIVDDRIGNGFSPFGGGLAEYGIDEFALDAVRAAAIQGPVATVELLRKWAAGERAPYQICAVLSGVTTNESLEMDGGVQLIPLSGSARNVSAHLPPHSMALYGQSDLSKGLRVSIDCTGGPALRRIDEHGIPERSWAYGSVPEDVLDILCEALSLVCDQYVRWRLEWVNCGEAEMFRLGATYGHARRRDEGHSYEMATLAKDDLPDVNDLFVKRLNSSYKDMALNIAVIRWMNSRGRSSLSDRAIEIRIALEALYLADSGPELRSRLATRGAWHLGTDFRQRRKYYQTLLDAYDLASKAVHGGNVKETTRNRDVVRDAQTLCRKGILKRIHEAGAPDWIELVLGRKCGD